MRGPCVQLQLHHGSQFSLVYAARVLDRVYTDWETYSSTSAVVAGGVTDRSSFLPMPVTSGGLVAWVRKHHSGMGKPTVPNRAVHYTCEAKDVLGGGEGTQRVAEKKNRNPQLK